MGGKAASRGMKQGKKQEVQGRMNWNQVSREVIEYAQKMATRITMSASVFQIIMWLSGNPILKPNLAFMALALVGCSFGREYWHDETKRLAAAGVAALMICCFFSLSIFTPMLGYPFSFIFSDEIAYPIAFITGIFISSLGFLVRFKPAVKFDIPGRDIQKSS